MKEEQECIETKVEMNQHKKKTNENNAGGYNSTIYDFILFRIAKGRE